MSKKRPAESGWESDEDDLLSDTGISAFRHEDVDELDEDALLGADDGGHAIGFEEQGQYGEAEEMLEIQVKDEELDEEFVIDDKEGPLDYCEDEYQGDAAYTAAAGESHGLQESAYDPEDGDSSFAHESVSQTDGSFNQESEESEVVFLNESDHPDASYQNESQDADVSYENESHALEEETPAEEEAKLEESDSDDSGDEDKHSRGRFISERSNIITLSKAKSRTDIPDTLEVSTEPQNQVLRNNVPRNRGNRGGGSQRGGRGDRLQTARARQAGQRGMLPQGPFQHAHQQPFGIRMPPYPHQSRHLQGHLPQFGQPLGFLGEHPGRLRFGPPQRHQETVNLGRPFGDQFPTSHMEPRPLLRIPQQQGNRILVPNQQGGFNMVPRQHIGGPALLPGQVPPGTPAPLHPQQSLLGPQLEADQPPVSVFLQPSRPNIPTSAPPRPHKIHINPNFRGPVPGTAMAPHSVVQIQPEPAFSQSGVHPAARPLVSTSGQMLVELAHQVPQQQLLPGHPRPGGSFSQLFPQQGPQMGAHGMMQQGLLGNFPAGSQISRPGLGQQQSGFPSRHEEDIIHHAQGSDGLLPEPPQFSQGLMHPPHPQNLSPGLTTSHLRIQPARQQLRGTGISISQPGGLTGQAQQQRQLLAARPPRRMGIQQRMPQKQQTVVMAKKLAQQARVIQQTKTTANKNITIVPLTPQKRRSMDNNTETPIAPKVARTADQQEAQEEEPMDEELKRGLEEQKRKREEIRRKKEEARKRQAEIRRKELEERLAKQGLTIDDIIGDGKTKTDEKEAAASKEMTSTSAVPKEDQPVDIQGAQPITTLVSRGVQQPTQRRLSAGNQPLRLQGRMVAAKRVAEMRRLPLNRSSSVGENVVHPAANLVQELPRMHQPLQMPSAVLTLSPSQQLHPEQQMQSSGVQQSQVGLRIQRQHVRPPHQQAQQLMPRMQQQQQQQQRPRMQQQQMLRMQQQGSLMQTSPQQLGHHPQLGEMFGISPQGQPQHPPAQRQTLSQFSPQQHVSERQVPQNRQQHQFQQQRQQPHFSVQQQHRMQENQTRSGELTPATTFRQTGRGCGFQGSGVTSGSNGSRGRGSNGSVRLTSQGYNQVYAQGQVSMGDVNQTFERVVKASSQASLSARTVISSKSQGAVSNRTVIPLGHQVQSKQRQIVKQGTMNKQAGTPPKVVAGPSTLQKVSIDNLSVSTTAQQLKAYCEAIGPIEDNIVMLESQRKAIITFKSKIHAMTFVKKWDRRMINLSIVHVTMLP